MIRVPWGVEDRLWSISGYDFIEDIERPWRCDVPVRFCTKLKLPMKSTQTHAKCFVGSRGGFIFRLYANGRLGNSDVKADYFYPSTTSATNGTTNVW